MLKDFERRLRKLEAVNQSRILKYGNITIDGENDRIVVADNTTNRILIDGTTGKIKVSRAGHDVLTTGDENLVMSSDYSTVREVQMQMSSTHRWTNTAPYEVLNDFKVTVDFSDWPDHSWFYEVVMKAGTGTAYSRLYNVTDGAAVSGSVITTTQTSPTQLRSSAITKPSGVKTFRSEYGHDPSGGPADYVDLYLARMVMRFVF